MIKHMPKTPTSKSTSAATISPQDAENRRTMHAALANALNTAKSEVKTGHFRTDRDRVMVINKIQVIKQQLHAFKALINDHKVSTYTVQNNYEHGMRMIRELKRMLQDNLIIDLSSSDSEGLQAKIKL